MKKYRIRKAYYKDHEDYKIKHKFIIETEEIVERESKKEESVGIFSEKVTITKTEKTKWRTSRHVVGWGYCPLPDFKTLQKAKDYINFIEAELPKDEIIE